MQKRKRLLKPYNILQIAQRVSLNWNTKILKLTTVCTALRQQHLKGLLSSFYCHTLILQTEKTKFIEATFSLTFCFLFTTNNATVPSFLYSYNYFQNVLNSPSTFSTFILKENRPPWGTETSASSSLSLQQNPATCEETCALTELHPGKQVLCRSCSKSCSSWLRAEGGSSKEAQARNCF